jgi:hypothetical protein
MPLGLIGNGQITGLSAGGLPDATVTTADIADGAITPAKTQVGALPSMVRVQLSNGYGSTNTCIKRFTNTLNTQGADITYTDSATLGASFTINTAGVYAMTLVANGTANQTAGISLNTTQPTTTITSITAADRIAVTQNYGGSSSYACSQTMYLAAGSVIRPHSDAAAVGAATIEQFTITRVA